MNVSEMTKDELIELVQQLQFSLNEAQKVIQYFAKDLPAYRDAINKEARDNKLIDSRLTLKQELEKYDLFKLYDSFVAADIFNGYDEDTAKQNAFDTVAEVLDIEGVVFRRDSLYKYFPANTKS